MVTKEDLERDYVSARAACKELGLSGSRMSRLCTGGRFKGAFKFGSIWLIPREAVKNHTKLKPGVKPKDRKPDSAAPDAPRRKRGRPRGSRNKTKTEA